MEADGELDDSEDDEDFDERAAATAAAAEEALEEAEDAAMDDEESPVRPSRPRFLLPPVPGKCRVLELPLDDDDSPVRITLGLLGPSKG